MALGKDSKKIQVIVSKKDAQLIEKISEAENRSVSNWVYTLVKKELEKKEDE